MTLNPPKFHTERLVYRGVRESGDEDDSNWLAALMSSPMNTMLASPGICTPIAHPSERTKSQLDYVKKAMVSIAICLPKSAEEPTVAGKPIGWMMLATLREGWEHHRKTSFGVLFEEEYTGKGYGTEALSWLVEQAFLRYNLNKVEGETIGLNPRALAAYERVGFKVEGRRQQAFWVEGQWTEEILIGITADEWWAARRAKQEAEKASEQ